ncbi:uncharacterized protein MYCFIDRAFT_176019 [Pseudocercospora fijiensis CIRAD86]|uniref:Uncharacterized protein n=1 Tax=Pseudocercospora fijiensis (strain CIRAD86) TaxID=383855 RepID=M3AZ59_PSEFD|nr:uncharacterized protein MYCFIDRAFT_176019 [Pseudocercospora fijiensis CIRAD86]EME82473.1 hypothetical protein MYCFIDRAFT_176019 [Pseudocercospora fijiensis CIRAD86]
MLPFLNNQLRYIEVLQILACNRRGLASLAFKIFTDPILPYHETTPNTEHHAGDQCACSGVQGHGHLCHWGYGLQCAKICVSVRIIYLRKFLFLFFFFQICFLEMSSTDSECICTAQDATSTGTCG